MGTTWFSHSALISHDNCRFPNPRSKNATYTAISSSPSTSTQSTHSSSSIPPHMKQPLDLKHTRWKLRNRTLISCPDSLTTFQHSHPMVGECQKMNHTRDCRPMIHDWILPLHIDNDRCALCSLLIEHNNSTLHSTSSIFDRLTVGRPSSYQNRWDPGCFNCWFIGWFPPGCSSVVEDPLAWPWQYPQPRKGRSVNYLSENEPYSRLPTNDPRLDLAITYR